MSAAVAAVATATAVLCCELCDAPMSLQAREGSPVRYHHCGKCSRWVASSYRDEMVRAGTARMETPASAASAAARVEIDELKARMAAWMRRLDEQDPYRVLGVSPRAPEEVVRARFHELAMASHPDRGGEPQAMRRILNAWEQVRRLRRGP